MAVRVDQRIQVSDKIVTTIPKEFIWTDEEQAVASRERFSPDLGSPESSEYDLAFLLVSLRIKVGRLPEPHQSEGRNRMKKLLLTATVFLGLALGIAVPSGIARPETRKEALKACHDLYLQSIKTADDSYKSAIENAKKVTGKERKDAIAAANKARADSKKTAKDSEKECIAKAPKK